jgi:hypothetical protein
VIRSVAVEARLAFLAMLAVRIVQTVHALASSRIAAARIVDVYVSVAFAFSAFAALFQRTTVVVNRALFASSTVVACLAVAYYFVVHIVEIASLGEILAGHAARTHALFASFARIWPTVVALYTRAAVVSVSVMLAVYAHASGLIAAVGVLVAAALDTFGKAPIVWFALVALFAVHFVVTVALTCLQVAKVVLGAARIAVAG